MALDLVADTNDVAGYIQKAQIIWFWKNMMRVLSPY